ncbi:hypothetical protein [Candidatus Nanohalobium constans]|uniref:Uncharacterized protein n=1 Tax=Candidatus Nanohalobium constans TaxID=2565781 RepID=A0A5Q0UG30_9ARCH|nr:hypothetical protein [Candidatus Nanohalobium constans]QGA80602.1 hypothetical protein LC1Nh_0713 [Candidatus Nanohalobium constans]
MNYAYLLPATSLLEIIGILTLLTNKSIIGPIDIGFSIPYLVSANIQGFALLIAGSILTMYLLMQMQE